ncbi:MAG: cytochrome oxidase putative small subunit CydP [Methylocystis sp.]
MTKRSLSREIGAALAFKLLALTVLYFLFFSGSHKTVVTTSEMATFLVNNHSAPQ